MTKVLCLTVFFHIHSVLCVHVVLSKLQELPGVSKSLDLENDLIMSFIDHRSRVLRCFTILSGLAMRPLFAVLAAPSIIGAGLYCCQCAPQQGRLLAICLSLIDIHKSSQTPLRARASARKPSFCANFTHTQSRSLPIRLISFSFTQ